MPEPFSCDWIEAKDLARTAAKDLSAFDQNIDEIGALQMAGPYLLASGAIKRNHGAFDSDIKEV
jgi:hypothetical protein